jgi:hypothetical protein
LLKEIELASPDSEKKEKIKEAEYDFGNSEGNTSNYFFVLSLKIGCPWSAETMISRTPRRVFYFASRNQGKLHCKVGT